jgi:cobalamin biosynthesis protein CbiD
MNKPSIEHFAIIWGIFGVLAGMAMIFTGGNIVLIAILAAAAVIGTLAISDNHSSTPAETEKAKRDSGSTGAMLELLDEDDIRELRQRIKRRIMDNIENGSDGELSSLDTLLAEQQLQKRK